MKLLKERGLLILMGIGTVAMWILDTIRTDKMIREETRAAVHEELFGRSSKKDGKEEES